MRITIGAAKSNGGRLGLPMHYNNKVSFQMEESRNPIIPTDEEHQQLLDKINQRGKDLVEAFHDSVAKHICRGELDPYWKEAMPLLDQFYYNQIGRVWLRQYTDTRMLEAAWQKAQRLEMPDISQEKEALLTAYALGYHEIWEIASTPAFQVWVDSQLPIVLEVQGDVIIDLIALQWWHLRLMEHCFNEVLRRTKASNLKKYTFGALLAPEADLAKALLDPEELADWRRWQANSYQWLQRLSHRIAKGMLPDTSDFEFEGDKALSERLMGLSPKPLHIQMLELGVTERAIKSDIIDAYREVARQPEQVSLDAIIAQAEKDGHLVTTDRELLLEIIKPDLPNRSC